MNPQLHIQTTTHLLIATLAIIAVACSPQAPDPPTMIQPGTSVVAISGIDYHTSGSDAASDDVSPVSLCDFTLPDHTVAIVEGTSIAPTWVPLVGDGCHGPYALEAWRGQLNLLAVATGQELPTRITVVAMPDYMDDRFPEDGETRLVSLRNLRGEWFVTRNIAVNLNTSNLESDSAFSNDFPDSFEELVSLSDARSSDFETECPDQAPYQGKWSEEKWESLLFGPSGTRCRPAASDDADASP